MYDDDLDRALLSLPLEPLPDGLRASIMAAVSVAARPVLTMWEMLGVGVILALGTWLGLTFAGTGAKIGPWVAVSLEALGRYVAEPSTLMWVAAGIASALVLSLVSIPRRVALQQ